MAFFRLIGIFGKSEEGVNNFSAVGEKS